MTSVVEASGDGGRCEAYCSRAGGELRDSPPDAGTCRACHALEIKEGRLRCPACDAAFNISEGIPVMIGPAMHGHGGAADKLSEMRARDEQVGDYDALRMLSLLSRLEVPKVVALLEARSDDLVIELGAGTGRVTAAVADRAGEVVAVDFSLESLKRSRSKSTGANVHWVQADINHLPLRDGVGDRVFSCQVFEHLPGAAMRNMAVDEAARILKGAGTFVISVYRDSLLWRLFGQKEGYHPGGIYYCRLSGREFRDLLARQFTIESVVPNVGLYLQMAKCVKEP